MPVGSMTADHLERLRASMLADKDDGGQKTEDRLPSSGVRRPSSEWPLQRDCDAFYGNPRPRNVHESYNTNWAREKLTHVACPWALHMGEIAVPFITIHKKVAPSLERVLARVWDELGRDAAKIRELRYDVFSGSFNPRGQRSNPSRISMHFYAAAIDWDAPDNQMHAQRHLFTDASLLVRAFKDEGWVWGGDWDGDGVDAMHVQAARVHG